MVRVLVIGSGGREHSLCYAIAKSPVCEEVICAPGNPGIEDCARCVNIDVDDIKGLVALAKEERVELVVIGPEIPLVLGLSDLLRASGIDVFGPSSMAAELEGSKGFMKDHCQKYNIPTANYKRFRNSDDAKVYVKTFKAPIVVKADGLAAGKGVIICQSHSEACKAIDRIMLNKVFGAAGSEIVIEEYLEGEEISFFALVSGDEAIPLVAAQDHKAVFDGDLGPNTGGMGAFSPSPIIDFNMTNYIMDNIIKPTIRGLVLDGRPYQGVLFAGLMMTSKGPRLIEYNCRFGDPECQTLMVRLKSDVLEMLLLTAQGRLDQLTLEWDEKVAITVVMANKGYPGSHQKGSEIKGLDLVNAMDGVWLFHSGTAKKRSKILAVGGRVLSVTALGNDLETAQKYVYDGIGLINWPERFYRRDIGWRALKKS